MLSRCARTVTPEDGNPARCKASTSGRNKFGTICCIVSEHQKIYHFEIEA